MCSSDLSRATPSVTVDTPTPNPLPARATAFTHLFLRLAMSAESPVISAAGLKRHPQSIRPADPYKYLKYHHFSATEKMCESCSPARGRGLWCVLAQSRDRLRAEDRPCHAEMCECRSGLRLGGEARGCGAERRCRRPTDWRCVNPVGPEGEGMRVVAALLLTRAVSLGRACEKPVRPSSTPFRLRLCD